MQTHSSRPPNWPASRSSPRSRPGSDPRGVRPGFVAGTGHSAPRWRRVDTNSQPPVGVCQSPSVRRVLSARGDRPPEFLSRTRDVATLESSLIEYASQAYTPQSDDLGDRRPAPRGRCGARLPDQRIIPMRQYYGCLDPVSAINTNRPDGTERVCRISQSSDHAGLAAAIAGGTIFALSRRPRRSPFLRGLGIP
jgi:hypothetical protein